jgi:hypothetical protein
MVPAFLSVSTLGVVATDPTGDNMPLRNFG